MTAPPEVLPAVSEGDDLLDTLREQVSELAETAVADRERERGQSLPAPLRDEVLARLRKDRDLVLSDTNGQISELRGALDRLAEHGRPPEKQTPGANPRDRVGHATFGFALALGLVYPLLCWELGRTLTGGVWLVTVLGLVVVAGLALAVAYQAVARAGVRFSGERALSGAAWPFVTGLAMTYGLLLWRSWTSSKAAMGSFWAVVVWGAAGLVALFFTMAAYAVAVQPAKDEEAGRRIPGAVRARGLFGAVVAGVAALLVVTGGVPLPVPEWMQFVVTDALALFIGIFAAPVSLSSELVPRRLSRDPGRRGSPGWKRRHKVLQADVRKKQQNWRKAVRQPLALRFTHHFNEVVNPSFSTTLAVLDRAALGQMRAGDRVVTSVEAGSRLEALLAGIQGGAVGVAGPRGAGKTTLLEAYQAGKFLDAGRVHISLLESVPVRYDAREFVLHLYARTCAVVIDFCRKRGGEPESGPRSPGRIRALWRRVWPYAAGIAAWAALGVAGAWSLRSGKFDLTALWWPVVVLLAAVTLMVIAAKRRPESLPGQDSAAVPVPPADLGALRARAEGALREIEFQQKHTSGWSGKVGVPGAGAELGRTGSREVTRQPRTYPQLVHEFSEFLRDTITCVAAVPDIATPSVVIILDELDKIGSPEAAQDFVNEVKALFNLDVEGFLFLVSVSEDALASFERRGLPVRDAFDSAFDVIFRLEYLKLDDAAQVLTSRVLGLADPFVCLCHSLSGGLPRELIRVARQVIGSGRALAEVARQVVADDLAGKQAGLRTIVARGGFDDVLVSDLVRHVDAHAAANPRSLIAAAQAPPIDVEVSAELFRLQVETLGYLYYLGTVLEVFGPDFDEPDLARGRAAGDGSFDALASVRQLFPVNARLAWLTINAFRAAWGLPVVPPPAPSATTNGS